MKSYKIPSPLPWLIILAVMIIAGTSCGIVNKNRSSNSSTSDSSGTHVTKEAESHTNDSTGKHISDSSGTTKENGEYERETTTYEYDSLVSVPRPPKSPKDSGANKNLPDSMVRIPVKKTTTKERGRTEKMQTVDLKKVDTSHVANNQTKEKSDSNTGKEKKNLKIDNSHKFGIQIPWYGYVIGVVAIGGVWFFWPYIRGAKKVSDTVLPYSNPKDKT